MTTIILFENTFYGIVSLTILLYIQYRYSENEVIAMRVLRMKHENVHQNITCNCNAGFDVVFTIQLHAANGETIEFGGDSIRIVSEVSSGHTIYSLRLFILISLSLSLPLSLSLSLSLFNSLTTSIFSLPSLVSVPLF